MRTFAIVLYRDHLTVAPMFSAARPWDEVVAFLESGEESPCTLADGPSKCKGKDCIHKTRAVDGNPMAWSPVELVGNRLDENVRHVSLLVLDLDHISTSERTHALTVLARYAHVWHSTHNHREKDLCYRVVVRLSRAVTASEYHRFHRNAVGFLGLPADPTCKNRSRLYFRPSWPVGAPHEFHAADGADLDVDEMLVRDPSPIYAPNVESRPLPEETVWDLDSEPLNQAIELIGQAIPPPGTRHHYALALAGMLRRAGATREIARYVIEEGLRQGGSSTPEEHARVVDHTWTLDAEDPMAGFTRVKELIGSDLAEEISDLLRDVDNQNFLDAIRPLEEAAQVDGDAAPTPPAVDFEAVRADVLALRKKKKSSKTREDQIDAALLTRALKGEALATETGEGDLETAPEAVSVGLPFAAAVRRLANLLAFALPTSIPWDALDPLLAACLRLNRSDVWRGVAGRQFERARRQRERLDFERERQIAEQRRALVEALHGTPAPRPTPIPLPPELAAPITIPVVDLTPSAPPPAPAAPPCDPMAPTRQPTPGWENSLQKTQDGRVASSMANVSLVLLNDPAICGYIRWNEITKRVMVTGGMFRAKADLGVEALVVAVQDHLSSAYNLTCSYQDLGRRIVTIARENRIDPLRDYLESLAWDGTSRLDTWLETYCGAVVTDENREFVEKVSRRWLIALVARALDPGCQVDNVLVIEGKGGIGKSTAFQILAGEWFCDSAIHLGDKDSRMLASQFWVCELAEIVAFKRGDHDLLKSFFSARVDKFRPPYGQTIEEYKRRCVFVGTTNDDQYLVDPTGNRKYWTVSCVYAPDGLEALRRDRGQLLAEAVACFRAGEKWHFGYEEIHVTEAEADKRMIETPVALKLREWWYATPPVERPRAFTTLEAYEMAYDVAGSPHVKASDLQAIGAALRKMGFVKRRDTTGPLRTYRYHATDELLEAEKRGERRTLFALRGGRDGQKAEA